VDERRFYAQHDDEDQKKIQGREMKAGRFKPKLK
jgi:hypothetical protein